MVYVDDMRADYGRMVMFHMIADTREELYDMANRIGVHFAWIQSLGTYREHFDICQSRKERALRLGAVQVTQRELMEKIIARKSPAEMERYAHSLKSK